jgi:hypothetical protein
LEVLLLQPLVHSAFVGGELRQGEIFTPEELPFAVCKPVAMCVPTPHPASNGFIAIIFIFVSAWLLRVVSGRVLSKTGQWFILESRQMLR